MNVAGIIACAGHGSRFRPITYAYSKALLPLGSATLLDLALHECSRFGLRRVVVVHSFGDFSIERYVRASRSAARSNADTCLLGSSSCSCLNLDVAFAAQDSAIAYGSAAPLVVGSKLVDAELIYLAAVDDVFIPGSRESVLAAMYRRKLDTGAAGVVGAARVRGRQAEALGTIVSVQSTRNERIESIREKVRADSEADVVVNGGRYLFDHDLVDVVHRTPVDALTAEWRLTDAINEYCRSHLVAPLVASDPYFNCGDPEGWLAAVAEWSRSGLGRSR